MRRPENLGDNERSDPDRVLAACPDPATAHAPADDFSAITRERRGNDLPGRVTHVLADGPPPLQSYTISLQTDSEAVVNGHTLQWSSGAVEGQVNRIKFLKRRSYGRASFDLLRTLVLAQPL
ncbi:ISL3 family transposase [Embleya hyalina]|uniref:ISL3 family transposase n=2 Tax=Embleya hyalina TaxID=516124 RepID=A0A401YRA3_9ACTN|nr:ISL3 family transposase [Embleya hyalina]